MRYALLFSFLLPLAAQEPRFDAQSRLVLVPVTVTSADGSSVIDLAASDFVVLDNKLQRRVSVDTIDTGVAPIALVIAIQSSGISGPVLEKIQGIASMVQPLVTGERGCAAVVSFAETIAWLQECSKDPDALGRALSRLHPGEHKKAAMLDAVDQAIDRLRGFPDSRRVVLLISESRDRGSEAELEAVTIAAQSANVTIYAVTYSALQTAFTSKNPLSEPGRVKRVDTPSEVMGTPQGTPPTKLNPRKIPEEQRVDLRAGIGEILRRAKTNTTEVLAGVTGGTTYSFLRQKGLEDAMEKLGAELHAQYLLSFAPETSVPGYHKLELRLVRPGKFHIRARPGYWSGVPQQQ